MFLLYRILPSIVITLLEKNKKLVTLILFGLGLVHCLSRCFSLSLGITGRLSMFCDCGFSWTSSVELTGTNYHPNQDTVSAILFQ